MKSILILGIILTGFSQLFAQRDCNEAFSAANYSVAHSNNAYDANNIDHVQEWSAKAMETFDEVERITADCGCEEANNLAYEGYEAASKAQDQNTWERSRFYAKRASEKAKLMMEALAEFTNKDVFDIESREYASNEDNIDDYYTNEDIEAEKAELIAQQKLLEERQAELARELEAKRIEAEAAKAARELEIKEQMTVKMNAEMALKQISDGYQSLANALGCKEAYEMAKSSFNITQEEIKNSDLSDTKLHFTLQLNEIAEQAMLNFSDCANSF